MARTRFAGGVVEDDDGELVAVHGREAPAVKRGLKLFREWSGRDAESVTLEETPAGTPAVLVELGELTAVQYASDKWGGSRREYIHDTQRPRPRLCSNAAGTRLFVIGGDVRVKPEGLIG